MEKQNIQRYTSEPIIRSEFDSNFEALVPMRINIMKDTEDSRMVSNSNLDEESDSHRDS
jgi:hypothetical protein